MSDDSALISANYSGPDFDVASEIIVFVHGITSNSHAWPLVIGRLPDDVAVISVDLRGRGNSAGLDGEWGIRRHAHDIIDLLDEHDINQPILIVGHAMGAFVASLVASQHPERVRGLVLIDGGIKLAAASGEEAGVTPDSVLSAVLGPALDQLAMGYPSRGEYRRFWQSLPVLSGQPWTDFLESYVQYGLGGTEPNLRSRVVMDAVRQDGGEILFDEGVFAAIESVKCPIELLKTEYGLSTENEQTLDPPALTKALAVCDQLSITTIPSLNHYTIVLSPGGADAVAAAIRRQL